MAIQIADLMPGAMNCIKNVGKIKTGEDVLIVTDTTSDQSVVDAYKIAIAAVGGIPSVLTLKSPVAGACSDEITSKALYGFWPKVACGAMLSADVCIVISAYTDIHGIFGAGADFYAKTFGLITPLDISAKYQTRMLSVVITNKEGLASSWATYPEPLLRYIERMAHLQLNDAIGGSPVNAHVKVTDPQGTDISFTGFRVVTKWVDDQNAVQPFSTFGTAVVGLQPADPEPSAEGIIVSTSIHTGYIPEMRMTVKGGKAVKLEGGGSLAKIWMADFEKHKTASSRGRHTVFGEHKYPGINWIEEFMYGLHPKAFRLGYKYRYEGADAFAAWVGGTRRSGVVHFGFGGGINETYRHRDLEVFAPTVTVNKEIMVEKGRLKILDDPKVRSEAAKYGDPDELLTEIWIPEMPPRD